jgi:protocatechuate 3,4-dioxygenase beta subunit
MTYEKHNEHQNEQPNINDLGLQADLAMWTRKPIERRNILKMGVLGIGVLLAGCGTVAAAPMATSTSAAATATATAATATATAASTGATSVTTVEEIPQETAGPYPADGSQASSKVLNALTLSGIIRQDIRTSLGTGNAAAGIPTTLELTLVDVNNNDAPLADYAMYLWHCNRDGEYSMYGRNVTDEDYLRGVQQADANGLITFTTIFPACYSGRWPHIHFEVYLSLAKATSATNALHTSQLALPEDVCKVAYATAGYEQSVKNLAQTSLDRDNVFGDGHDWQVATVTGDPTNGYKVALTVGVEG